MGYERIAVQQQHVFGRAGKGAVYRTHKAQVFIITHRGRTGLALAKTLDQRPHPFDRSTHRPK